MPSERRELLHRRGRNINQPDQSAHINRNTKENNIVATTDSSISPDQSVPESSTAQRFQCSQCPRTFTRRENLSRHAKTHSAPWAHRCSICGKGFARSDLLSRHEAGHQRWSKQDSGLEINVTSYKRRKIASGNEIARSGASSASHDHLNSEHVETAWDSSLQDVSMGDRSLSMPKYNNSSNIHPRSAELVTQQEISKSLQPEVPQASLHASYSQPELFQRVVQSRDYLADLASNDLQLASFDFSGFLLPSDGNGIEDFSEWFSNDFYSAMQETGNEYARLTGLEESNFPSASLFDQERAPSPVELGSASKPQSLTLHEFDVSNESGNSIQSSHKTSESYPGRISRMSSPPNEASEEDRWAFAWDPKSRAILHADPISIPPEHPLWRQHKPRFDISDSTFRMLQKFLSPRTENLFHTGTFNLPSLPEVNILIGLFFEHFSPRMPVLHHATVDTNKDLPPPLLGAIIVIGAMYSRLRGTRRFAIVLLDIVRWHLQIAIENDNILMRDPSIMFAETLICYSGLWCGNKRAFELAEVGRATVVKHVRSAHFWRGNQRSTEKERSGGERQDSNLTTQWLNWIQKESQKRLFWVIYALDVQFTSLLYLPATFAMGEVCDLCCPCDEEFWAASNARHWKSVLGPAMVPPSRIFSAAAAPFLWSHWNSKETTYSGENSSQDSHLKHFPVLGLNDWSAFLVLITLHSQIFQFSQERLFMNSCFGFDDKVDDEQYYAEQGGLDSLSSWQDAYLSNSSNHDAHATSIHFRHSSSMGYTLAFILLDAPFTEIQDALGKNGKTGMASAKSNLRHWINTTPQTSEDIVHTAIKAISNLTSPVGPSASEQLIITTFLCHVIVWIYASIASTSQKKRLLDRWAQDEVLWKSSQIASLRKGLEVDADNDVGGSEAVPNASKSDRLRGIFRSAAECLTQLGTWGAALNLALLLQRRSEM